MAEWPHAPIHQLDDRGAYIITAGTYLKHHLFAGAERLTLLHELLELAPRYGWRLQAWAVFSNHYHVVAMSPENPQMLRDFVGHLHADTARRLNALDDAAGRRVWFNYWDTHLTYERSYWTRLQYVHENPVHHGLVRNAVRYRWCSAEWFEASADAAFFKMVSALKTDRVKVRDDYDVAPGD